MLYSPFHGFGPFFVKWVDLFYFNSRSSVNGNSYASESFSLSRGVPKGSPLSLLLYILVVEDLPCSIRANPYRLHLRTSLVVCSDLSIRVAFSVFSDHESGSGAKLNRAKCKGLWLGLRNRRIDSPVDIEWTSEMAKFLAGFVGPGNLEEANWRPCITAVENTPISCA